MKIFPNQGMTIDMANHYSPVHVQVQDFTIIKERCGNPVITSGDTISDTFGRNIVFQFFDGRNSTQSRVDVGIAYSRTSYRRDGAKLFLTNHKIGHSMELQIFSSYIRASGRDTESQSRSRTIAHFSWTQEPWSVSKFIPNKNPFYFMDGVSMGISLISQISSVTHDICLLQTSSALMQWLLIRLDPLLSICHCLLQYPLDGVLVFAVSDILDANVWVPLHSKSV